MGEALQTVIAGIAIPYGYTLAIWSSGALAIYRYGGFTARDILLFVSGAVLAYLVLDFSLLFVDIESQGSATVVPPIALANIVPMVSAIAMALLIKRLSSRALGFALSGFSATLVYTLVLTALVWAWRQGWGVAGL